ncbi:MAG: hypothetical protein HYR74_06915, partial [Candidatus Eisenbacteria bacterium]|nr:hypothetical protein [Candidatus Eisenbacteria bacterium]
FGALWPGPLAFRATALSACCGAAAVAALVVLLGEMGLGLAAALAGAALIGAGFTFRLASIRPEVYTLAGLLLVLAFRTTLLAAHSGRRRDVATAGVLMGLAVTGHFAMAPAVAVLGAWLALRPAREGRPARALFVAAGAAAGLLPYFYLVTQDRPYAPMNYLVTTIELGARQFGLTPATFAHAWQRIPWLVLGHETRPTFFLLHPGQLRFNLELLAAHALFFDPGPLVTPIAIVGLAAAWRRDRTVAALLATLIVVSVLFAAALAYGKLLPVFAQPATLGIGLCAAFGIEAIAARVRATCRSVIAVRAAIVVTLVLGVVLAQALRIHAQSHPIGPLGWHVEEKPPRITTLLPRLDRYDEARRYGAAAMRTIPPGALVVGRWTEIAILRYLREVEGVRRDLTLDSYYPAHRIRLERWQRAHDPRERPLVFLSRWPELGLAIAPTESLEIRPGRWMRVQRTPLAPAAAVRDSGS